MKKFLAPLIITVLFVAYIIVYFALIIYVLPNILSKILLGIFPLIFAAVMIYVFIQRINEIKKGEDDDLSKY